MQSEKRKNIIKKCIQDQFPNLLFTFQNEEKDENIIFHLNTVHNGVSVNICVYENYSWNEIKQRIGNALITDKTCHICFETLQNITIGCKCTLKMCFDCYIKIDPENEKFKCPVCKHLSEYVYSLEFFKSLTIYQFQEYELLRFQQLLMEEESYKLLEWGDGNTTHSSLEKREREGISQRKSERMECLWREERKNNPWIVERKIFL